MIDLSHKDILNYFAKIKKFALQSYMKGEYEKSLSLIELAASVAYYLNFIYTDRDIEGLLTNISSKMIKQEDKIVTTNQRFVFYDAFEHGGRVLTLQYIRALISNGCEFLFIFENYVPSRGKSILDELNAYDQCEVFMVDQKLSKTEQINTISQKIVEYQPQKALLQLLPWSVVAVCVFNALSNVKRYQINLTDHAFWLGVNCIDYNIEFRQHGATISLEKRGITKEKLLLLTYYPIFNENEPFKGFPEICNDKVIIFSGGSFFKIYGEKKKYFQIVKTLLDRHPNIIILFSGDGDDQPILKFIKKNNFQNRFILLGFRLDINAVFANCDIYLATYPFGGGLMTMYAATHAKPVLAYGDNSISEIVAESVLEGVRRKISFSSFEEFYEEADQLINNKEYRLKVGRSLKKDFYLDIHKFNADFKSVIINQDRVPNFDYSLKNSDYDKIADIYLEVENKFLHVVQYLILQKFKLKTFILFPKLAIKFSLQKGLAFIIQKLLKRKKRQSKKQ